MMLPTHNDSSFKQERETLKEGWTLSLYRKKFKEKKPKEWEEVEIKITLVVIALELQLLFPYWQSRKQSVACVLGKKRFMYIKLPTKKVIIFSEE